MNNESERLKVLNKYKILDIEAKATLNDLAQLASEFCQTPVALISFLDAEKEYFQASIGVNITEVPRSLAFAHYTIFPDNILIINDTLDHHIFSHHPLVKSQPCLRFYAGVPLINSQGFNLGCLSVMDFNPRELSIQEQKSLKSLAQKIINYLELHQPQITQNPNTDISNIIPAISIPLTIFRISDGSILYTNTEFIEIFNFDYKNLQGSKIADLYENISQLNVLIEKLCNYGYVNNEEISFKTQKGDFFWAITSLQYLKYNHENVGIMLLYDITKHKKYETELETQNHLLKLIFKHIPLMIALNDVNGKVRWVNRKLEETLGWNLQEFQTQNVFAQIYPDPEYRQTVIDFMQSAKPVWRDFQAHLRDGNLFRYILDKCTTS